MSYPRSIIFANEDEPCMALMRLLSDGKTSMLSGMDAKGISFSAFAWPDGDDVFCEALMQHPYWPTPAWTGVRCEECGGLPRKFPLENLAFPAVVLLADMSLVPLSDPQQQPPPVEGEAP